MTQAEQTAPEGLPGAGALTVADTVAGHGFGHLVRLEVADGVGVVRLDRPPMNALSVAMQEELRAVAAECSARDDVRAVVIFGGDRVFAAGADVKEMATMTYAEMARRSIELSSAFAAVAGIPKPVIAAITGYALGGGCELALSADLRIAGDNAQLGQPEILLGLIPGAGGTQRLPRLVGPSRAKEIIYTGRFVRADEALRIGLVDRVVPADDVLNEAMILARKLALLPALSMTAAKRAIDNGLETDIVNGLEIERLHFASLFATEDARTGMTSFVEKGPGKAVFSHR